MDWLSLLSYMFSVALWLLGGGVSFEFLSVRSWLLYPLSILWRTSDTLTIGTVERALLETRHSEVCIYVQGGQRVLTKYYCLLNLYSITDAATLSSDWTEFWAWPGTLKLSWWELDSSSLQEDTATSTKATRSKSLVRFSLSLSLSLSLSHSLSLTYTLLQMFMWRCTLSVIMFCQICWG